MALTRNTPLPEELGAFNSFPVAAAATIYLGSALSRRLSGASKGYVGALAAGEPFCGHAYHGVDNSAGAAGALNVQAWGAEPYRLEVPLVASLEDVGRAVYASDDATYTLDPSGAAAANTFVGYVHRYVSATKCVVNFLPVTFAGLTSVDDVNKVVFFDDFLGLNPLLAETGSLGIWEDVVVGDATVAAVADAHGGAVALTIAATSEAEDAVLYAGDQLQYDIDALERMEFRAKVTTPGTGVRVVMGMAGDHNLDKDTVAQNAWFSLDAGLALKAESDDGTTDVDDETISTITTAVWYDFAIDFTDKSDIKFFLNGVQVATSATFTLAAYTGTLQPYFSADKASGTGVTVVTIDYVKIVARRQ